MNAPKTLSAITLMVTAMLVMACTKPNIVGGGTYNGHEYIDLGLPSGTLWATCNVGASTPEDYGDYFAWGETDPKTIYDWDAYKYCVGNDTALIKYCTNSKYGHNGFTDNLTTLQPEDDAATANWGSGWCMPSKMQLDELEEYTAAKWTSLNGVKGRLFTARNGNALFLPAVGYRSDAGLHTDGDDGAYWLNSTCSSIYPEMDYPNSAQHLHIRPGYGGIYYVNVSYGGDRCFGFAVRPVRSAHSN